MSDPRKEAYAAVSHAEREAADIEAVLTVGSMEQIKRALVALAEAQRRAVEWIDAIEI